MEACVTIRIRFKDYLAIKKVFPSAKNETVIDYFTRLSEFLKGGNYKK